MWTDDDDDADEAGPGGGGGVASGGGGGRRGNDEEGDRAEMPTGVLEIQVRRGLSSPSQSSEFRVQSSESGNYPGLFAFLECLRCVVVSMVG
jgi:hypothetical protein